MIFMLRKQVVEIVSNLEIINADPHMICYILHDCFSAHFHSVKMLQLPVLTYWEIFLKSAR